MRIRISTIVWFVLAVFVAVSMLIPVEKDPDEVTWSDAVFVEDAKVLPENEGKFVAVSGHPEMLEAVTDENVGVGFNSPRVHRTVDRLTYDNTFDTWEVRSLNAEKTQDGLGTDILYGRVSVGDFELDQELIKRMSVISHDVKEEDFTSEEIALMESTGNLQNAYSMFCYVDRPGMTDYKVWKEPEEYDWSDYMRHGDWDGARRVRWSMWEIKSEDEVTVVGIQKGNTLTYCDELSGLVSKDRIVSEEELRSEPANPILVKVMGFAIALVFALLGVKSMFKKKKDDTET